MATVLIVDDNDRLARSLTRNFELRGHTCLVAGSGAATLARLRERTVELILLDIRLDGESGLDVLDRIRTAGFTTPVVVITGNATLESAIGALKKRVVDYIRKPIDFEELFAICRPILQPVYSGGAAGAAGAFVASSEPMRALLENAAKLAQAEIPVLITGESGTGKELLADFIHGRSHRAARPIYKFNCAALPDALLESELFGHTRGAFTGAVAATPGIFERADGTTLFLDEIGDMPIAHQAKILRVLQNNEVRRVGSTEVIRVDVRFVAATNQDIDALLRERAFREDLFYRLAAGHLHIPPLRERREEIVELVRDLSSSVAAAAGVAPMDVDDEVLDLFHSYDWPGNVRELKNTIQYAYAVSNGHRITATDLPKRLPAPAAPTRRGSAATAVAMPRRGPAASSVMPSIPDAERDLIRRTLITTRNNKKEAARILKISRSTLYEKLRKFGLQDVETPSADSTR